MFFCLLAGCATFRTAARQTSRKTPSSQVAVASKDPKLPYRLVPVRNLTTSQESEPELVPIDPIEPIDPSDSQFANLESLDPSWFEFGSPKKDSVEDDKGSVWERVLGDQANFYSSQSLAELGLALGAGALVANTSADVQLQKHFQSSVRGASSDEWFQFLHANKELGNGLYTLPIFGAAWLAGEYLEGPPDFELVGNWGERTTRGFLVGVPPMILMQNVTGGSRPLETPEHSEWHPFRDNNGVSGHAFMSSLPFITAAKMTEEPWKKTFWYAASTIGPLSRINDNAHYPSQIGIGWAMAFVAASSVQQTDTGRRGWTIAPLSSLTSSGMALEYKW